MNRGPRIAVALAGGVIVTVLGALVLRRVLADGQSAAVRPAAVRAAPVEVAPIESGEMVLRRTFSGALEATAEFVVASKVGGRVEEIAVDLADRVARGAVVVVLDDDEPQQMVHQAQAGLEVARANQAQAESALEVAQRSLDRIELLREQGVSSESALDAARADQLACQAGLAVARAQVTRAVSALESARIRLDYTRVAANWTGGDAERLVAQRFVDEGETVSPNQALLTIVELDPITGVIQVPERDYAQLRPGQEVSVSTQAWPGLAFEGVVARIAPVFNQSTRQARVELTVANDDQRLKPGMFLRATVRLDQADAAAIVPEAALTERDGELGVFVVAPEGRSVTWRPVRLGIREGGRVQIEGEGLVGRVVTLGQQLIEDGSSIVIPPELPGPRTGERAPGAGGAAQL